MIENLNGAGNPLPDVDALSPNQWREMCLELLAEREQLRTEFAKLRRQCQLLLEGWFPENGKEATLSKEEMFALRVTEPSLNEFIDNIERSLGSTKQ
jgi:hypothetical protein